MEKNNNIGGFLANEANRIVEGRPAEPTFAAPTVTDQSLCQAYQELLRCSTDEAEWRFMTDLENYMLGSGTPFSIFYRLNATIHPDAIYRFQQKKSFIQKLFPKLKDIPLKVGVQAELTNGGHFGILVISVPFISSIKEISFCLNNSEALLVGEFPKSPLATGWKTLDADKIDFIHPIVPEGLRPLVAAYFAGRYGWTGAQHIPSQLLLENTPRQ